MVMMFALNDRGASTTPAGWTAIGGLATSIYNGTVYAYYKVASGSEPANYSVAITDNSNSKYNRIWIAAFRGVDNTTPVNTYSVSPARMGTTAPAAASLTTTVADCALAVFCTEINQHTPTITASGSLTLINNYSAAHPALGSAYNLTTGAAGAYSPGAFSSSVSNDFYVMAIALAPSGGGDTTAPTLTSPTGTQTGSTTASGTVTTDEGNGTLYYLASTNATETAVTVKAASSQAVSGTGSQSVSFTGLTASTTYYAHYCHRDAAGNDSAVANSTSFTTAAPPDTTVPTLTGSITSSAITQTTYTLSWPTGADNVAVTAYEYNLNGGAFVSTGTATTVNITGRTASTTDTITVRAKDAAGNVSTPVLSTTVNLLAVVVPSITTPVLKNNTGTVLASETGVVVNVYNASTGALVLQKTGLTSNGSGIVTFTDAALSAATSYAYEVVLSGGRRRLPLVTTA
jgi:hypothetical protein